MKLRPLIIVMLGASLVLGASPQTVQKAPVKPAPAGKTTGPVPGKVDQFLKVVQEAQTINEVRIAFDKAAFNPSETAALKTRIESSATIRKRIEQLQAQAMKEMTPATAQGKRTAKADFQKLNRELAERQRAQFSEQGARIRQALTASAKQRVTAQTEAAIRCQSDIPVVEKVYGPVMPGVEFGIEGRGFGTIAGSIDVLVDGHIFRASVNEWTPCYIYAKLAANIDGVRQRTATVSLRISDGKEASQQVMFVPVMEARMETADRLLLSGYCCGNHHDWNVFGFRLINDWTVSSVGLSYWLHDGDGHAETTSEPPKNYENVNAEVRVHGGVSGFATIGIDVTLYLVGPKGLAYKE